MESNLLKEAIADAKAVRQTALANAKAALEEAFSERYHAMFAEKLREDAGMGNAIPSSDAQQKSEENIGEHEIDELIKELESEVGTEPEVPSAPTGDSSPSTPSVPSVPVAPMGDTGAGTTIPVTLPVTLVAKDASTPGDSAAGDLPPTPPSAPSTPPSDVTSGETDEEINLDELLQSLKEEIENDDDEETKKLDEDKKLASSGIAPGNNKKPSASASSSSGIETGGMKNNGVPEGKLIKKDPTDVTIPEKNIGDNKDWLGTTPSIKEGIGLKNKGIPDGKQTSSGQDATEVTIPEKNIGDNKDGLGTTPSIKEENIKLKKQLDETLEGVKYLKTQLNEINLLNAKLLYTNRLLKEYSMNDTQKMRIIEMFDLAKNVREVKMTYSNLAETLNFGGIDSKKKVITPSSVQSITEGLASKPVGSTKPSKQIISEGKSSEMVSKFQKLAGIKRS